MNKSDVVQPILQYPTDLVFAILEHDVSALLTVLKTQELMINDYKIQFAIIGESHCITVWHDGQFVLQEVLACTDIPEILQAKSHKFAKLEAYQDRKQDYRARVWFAETLQNTNWQHYDELKMNFPATFGQVPFTHIQWTTSNQSIQWRTVHVYPLPTNTTYVYTESYFDLNERINHGRINRTYT